MFMKINVFSVLTTVIIFPSISSNESTTIFTPKKTLCSSLVQRCVKSGQLPADDGQCYFPFSRGPCTLHGSWFILSAQESFASGQLKGVCARRPCKRRQVLHQDRCTSFSKASVEVCRNGPLHVDLEGNLRCGINPGWRVLLDNALPCNIENYIDFNDLSLPGQPRCSSLVELCLARSLLPNVSDNNCYEPLSQGPCSSDNLWFTLLNPETSASTQLTGACVPRPCSARHIQHEGRCVLVTKASNQICAGGAFYQDLEGKLRCGDFPGWQLLIHDVLPCKIQDIGNTTISRPRIPNGRRQSIINHVRGIQCAQNNMNVCQPSVSIVPSSSNTSLDIED